MKIIDNKYYYEYDDIHHMIEKSVPTIKNMKPDIVISIGGGGLIPARILRNYINMPIYVMTVKAYDTEDTITSNIEVIQWFDMDLSGKKVLLVDEIDDTRTTLKFCVERLKTVNRANEIGIFVLHNKKKAKTWTIDDDTISYHAATTIKDNWVVYPWDAYTSSS